MKWNGYAQRGSVIMWIFIAIGLFAALSFTVAQMMRSGSPEKMNEVANLRASAIMQYAGAVQRGVRVMRVDGADESELCFHTAQWGHNNYEHTPPCNDNANLIFNPAGGGIGFQQGVAEWYETEDIPAGDSGTWVFSARFEIENTGTDNGEGDADTDSDPESVDLVMATAPVRDDVCESINLLLDHDPGTPPAAAASTYDNLAADKFAGSYTGGAGRIGNFGRERCIADPAGYNIYYKVILAR